VSLDVACLDRIYLNGYLPTVRSTTRRSSWPGGRAAQDADWRDPATWRSANPGSADVVA
jgi:hypothetical protein